MFNTWGIDIHAVLAEDINFWNCLLVVYVTGQT